MLYLADTDAMTKSYGFVESGGVVWACLVGTLVLAFVLYVYWDLKIGGPRREVRAKEITAMATISTNNAQGLERIERTAEANRGTAETLKAALDKLPSGCWKPDCKN